MKEDDLISELRKIAENLGHSPKSREIRGLAMRCYKYFGSFNRAKIMAGLEIKNVKTTEFPKNAFDLDKDLAAIVSYITFDGHLYKDLKGFYYSSKNIKDLKMFELIVKRKFGLPARYHLNNPDPKNKTGMVYFFNKNICEFLFNLGAPKGEKVTQIYDVPKWITNSKELSREYLKVAYLCEGSLEKEKGRKPRISFIQSKHVDILNSGLNFMNTLKGMLINLEIKTGKSYVSKDRIRRKDNKIMRDIRFRVKVEDNNKFISEIGWLK